MSRDMLNEHVPVPISTTKTRNVSISITYSHDQCHRNADSIMVYLLSSHISSCSSSHGQLAWLFERLELDCDAPSLRQFLSLPRL